MNNWIVVVDDEPMSLMSVRTMLGNDDMKISCLRSGHDLLKFMEKNEPDLILMDVMMPGMDGFETYEALRENEKKTGRKETPVIFLTGDIDSSLEHQGLKLGAADYIHKSFNRDVLLRRIRNTISNSRHIESLTEDATFDGLTHFLNKTEGTKQISELCKEKIGVLAILDLDNFKLVNDLFGHDKGDEVLSSFSDVVRKCTRGNDTLCRIGGDEFMGFFPNLLEIVAVEALTKRLNDQFMIATEMILGVEHGLPLGISIGAVKVPDNGRDYDILFSYADEALYRSKNNGKHMCTVYTPKHDSFHESLTPDEELQRLLTVIEERNEGVDAMFLGMDIFSVLYHFIERVQRRHGDRVARVLFVLSPVDPHNESAYSMVEEKMSDLEDVLKLILHTSDIVMKNKSNQYFIVMPLADEMDVDDMISRVIKAWESVEGHEQCILDYSKA